MADGATVTERFLPVRRVGLHVPGGKAVYPSSVLMNVIPAQEAGVSSMVVCSPPQAEHGEQAASVLITDSAELAEAVDREIEARYRVTLNSDRVAAALSGPQSGIVPVSDIEAALAVSNAYAPEHLEIHTRDANAVAAGGECGGGVRRKAYARAAWRLRRWIQPRTANVRDRAVRGGVVHAHVSAPGERGGVLGGGAA